MFLEVMISVIALVGVVMMGWCIWYSQRNLRGMVTDIVGEVLGYMKDYNRGVYGSYGGQVVDMEPEDLADGGDFPVGVSDVVVNEAGHQHIRGGG